MGVSAKSRATQSNTAILSTLDVAVRASYLPNSSFKGDGVRVFLSERDCAYLQDFIRRRSPFAKPFIACIVQKYLKLERRFVTVRPVSPPVFVTSRCVIGRLGRDTVSHAYRTWCRVSKTKLCVKVLCLAVRDKADVPTFRNVGLDVFHDFGHDSFP